jgi:hypothetical protein
VLPLITVAAWLTTVFVPILDSGNTVGPRILVTSLSFDAFPPQPVEPVFIAAWVAVLTCAGLAWVSGVRRWWSVLAIMVAIVLAAVQIAWVLNPPFILWDGVDAQGRPVGGHEEAVPAIGILASTLGIAALFVAGILARVRPGRSTTDSGS